MSYTDALGQEKEGKLIEIEGMPYALREPWTIEELKAALSTEGNSRPLRCRLGLHSWEVVANYEPLPPGLPPDMAKHTLGLTNALGEVSICKRCWKGRRQFG